MHPEQCAHGRNTISVLHHEISASGILPLHRKVCAVQEFPQPITTWGGMQCLGLINYYPHFINEAVYLLQPIHQMCDLLQPSFTDECCQLSPQPRRALSLLVTSPKKSLTGRIEVSWWSDFTMTWSLPCIPGFPLPFGWTSSRGFSWASAQFYDRT